MRVGALLLAAGASRRYGSDKRMVRLASGETLLGASLAACLRVNGSCTVVLDRADSALQLELAGPGVSVVQVAGRAEGLGMGDSLAAGIRDIARQGFDACTISLADMPWIADETRGAVVGALHDHPIVVPAWRGQWGHPVGFRAEFFAELGELAGDRGARVVLQRHAATLHLLDVPDRGVVTDVDTPADL